jgi:hypothetical protein
MDAQAADLVSISEYLRTADYDPDMEYVDGTSWIFTKISRPLMVSCRRG